VLGETGVQTMTFEILTIIVIVNVLATIELWRIAARRPVKLKRKFRDRLWRGKPITPKHEPPPPPTADMFVPTADSIVNDALPEQFPRDFEDFANVINWQLATIGDY
jgi:hypothetical protein